MSSEKKPTLDEVIAYGTQQINMFIGKKASYLPKEQQDEIRQEGYLRLLRHYSDIDADKGWKSFVYNHSRGTVLDYLKGGTGFEESRWSLSKQPEDDDKTSQKVNKRVSVYDDNNDSDLGIDSILSFNGIYSEDSTNEIKINWDLVECMASQDEAIHAFAKFIRGISAEDMRGTLDLCRSRSGQLIQSFVARFDDPELCEDPWFLQTCFAFGLCEKFGLPNVDQSDILGFKVGWSERKVDLDANKEPVDYDSLQTTIFDMIGDPNGAKRQ